MSQIIIDDRDLIGVVKKRVGASGQISVGTEHAGEYVTVYILCSKKDKDDQDVI